MDIIKTIEKKIYDSINIINIDIIDESTKHADHYFTSSSTLPSHIKLVLISDSFIKMNTLKRHKFIYELLKSEIEQLHAISLHLYTQSEYNLKINNKNVKEESLLVKAGRKFNDYKGSMNPPICHSSTILFPTYKDYLSAANGESIYDVINDGIARDYSYSSVGTPTVHYLSNALAEIEGRGQALIYPSGLFALTFAILTFAKAGSHILIQDNSYYRLKRFAENELPKRGVEVTFYDPTQDIASLILDNTSLIMIETPGSVTFEISDIESIVKTAQKHEIVTICDNSWATPLLFKPLDYGIDIALYAVTKYIAGHSDLLMGVIVAEEKIFKLLYENYKNYGVTVQSHDCYLAHRGLRTLHVRMKKHQSTAIEVAKWLEKHPKIKKVLYPALSSHSQYELWKSYFKGASSTFSIVLNREYSCKELSCMVDNMKIFSIGASWGGCDSLILPIDSKSMPRSVMSLDYDGSFVRIFCGLEDPEDLISDLDATLVRLPCSSVKNDKVECETERATA